VARASGSLTEMDRAVPRGARDELDLFRRLVDITILATFALIVIGGIVRVSDSGLGCGPAGSGTEGWPLCGGRLLPFLETEALIEFTHRAVAGVVAVLIALLAWRALRRLRAQTWLVRGSILAGVLVLVQAALGGLTVEHNLEELLVAAHLGLAMLLLGTLIALRRLAHLPGEAASPAPAATGLRPLALVASALLLATIVAGGWMAGTEREGAEGPPVVHGAHLACGEEFPTCNGELLPFGQSRLGDIHLAHRALMYLAAAAIIALVALALRRGIRSRALPLAAGLLGLQVLLGALNVWLGEHGELVVAHLSVGTLLWATIVYVTMELVPIPATARTGLRRRDAEEATAPA
jgi:heme A synthase